jgi:hypothetical protein
VITLTVTRLDTDEEVYTFSRPISFPGPLSEVRVLIRPNDLSFPAPGVYQFMILIDDEYVTGRRITILS